jgi:hypothetical protein
MEPLDADGSGDRCGCRRCRRSRGNRAGFAVGVDSGNKLIRNNGTAIANHDFGEHAASRRRNLQHDLVGLDFNQDFVHGDSLARLFFPLQHRGLGHGLRQLGNFDVDDCHFNSFGIVYVR